MGEEGRVKDLVKGVKESFAGIGEGNGVCAVVTAHYPSGTVDLSEMRGDGIEDEVPGGHVRQGGDLQQRILQALPQQVLHVLQEGQIHLY